MQDARGMQCNCISLSSKVLVRRMLFIYIEFLLIRAAMLTFLPLEFLSLNTTALQQPECLRQSASTIAVSTGESPGLFPGHAYTFCRHKSPLWEVHDAGRNSQIRVFQWCYSCQYCHLTEVGRKGYRCRPDLSLHCFTVKNQLPLSPMSQNAIFFAGKDKGHVFALQSMHSLECPWRKKIKEMHTTWGKVSQVGVDLCQFKDIRTVIFSSFLLGLMRLSWEI